MTGAVLIFQFISASIIFMLIAIGVIVWYFIRNINNKHKSSRWVEKINSGKVNMDSLRSDLCFTAASRKINIDNLVLRTRFQELIDTGSKLGNFEIKLVKEMQPGEFIIVAEAEHKEINPGSGTDVSKFDYYTFMLAARPDQTSVYTALYSDLDDKNNKQQFGSDLFSHLTA